MKKKIDYMWDELETARKYTIAAHAEKHTNAEFAKTLISIAKDELKHYEMLYKECTRRLDESKRTGKEPDCKTHFDCSKDDLVKDHLEIKFYIEQFDRDSY